MKKSKKIFLILIIAVSITYFWIYYKFVKENFTTNSNYSVKVFKVNGGYGYMILDDTKVLIKQEHVPSLEKYQVFCNYDDAKKVGAVVVKKLSDKKSPSINKIDLKKLNIKLECN